MGKTTRMLFVLGKYFPKAGANGVCVSRVQEALLQRGVFSDVIVEGEKNEIYTNSYGNIYVTALENGKHNNRIQNVLTALRYPIYHPENVEKYDAAIEKVLEQNDYDAIVAVLKPLDGAVAAARYSNLLVYELDSVTNNIDNEHGFRKILRGRTYYWERILYNKARYIFHMQSHEDFYSHNKYDAYGGKSEFVDIPQLLDEGIEDCASGELCSVKAIYSGILNKQMRSPEYLIELINAINEKGTISIEANFYSRGNCEDLLENAQKLSDRKIRQRGYVTLDELNQAVARADVLLSIGNFLTGKVTSLPSKVISYMSYGKPIIHIDGGNNDVAKAYLEKYPLAIVINRQESLHNNVSKLTSFLEKNIGKRVSLEDTMCIFEKNTPQYTADRMLQVIEKNCQGIVKKINT